MKDITYNEKEYIEGFNLGYKVSKDLPELAGLISQVKSEGAKFEGLRDGREQYVYDLNLDKELDKERMEEPVPERNDGKPYPSWLKDDRFEDLDKNIDKDEAIEPEV